MPRDEFPAILAAGDCGILVLFGDSPDSVVNNAAHAFDRAISGQRWPGVEEVIPAIRGVLVRYDPLTTEFGKLSERLQCLLDERDWLQCGPVGGRRLWRLPARYGDEGGPDLGNVAEAMQCSEDEVIRRHTGLTLRVLMLGFAPGCAYLGNLPEAWDLPRLDHVKPEVPPGSLSVAVRQTVLFATPIPTGWRTIGRTPFLSFSRSRPPHFFLAPGDEVAFYPVDNAGFREMSDAVAAGAAIVEPETIP